MITSSAVDPDRIFQEVLQHQAEDQPQPPTDSTVRLLAGLRQRTGYGSQIQFPPLGRVPTYHPSQDSRENFEAQIARLETQLQSLRSQGALSFELAAFRLQREAELDQMFPKQALRQRTEENWKAAALLMKQKGVAPEEIRKYLKRKAADHQLPTDPEIKAFIQLRKQFAAQIALFAQGIGAPAPVPADPVEPPKLSSGDRPQDSRPVGMHKP